MRRQAAALRRLLAVALRTNAQSIFAALLLHLCLPKEDGPRREATHGSVPAKLELLAYHLYPLFRATDNGELSPADTVECIEVLDELSFLQWHLQSEIDIHNEPFVLTVVRRQAEVVRGSAYPEQITSRIVEIQGRFENWFHQRLGIGPLRAQEILWALARVQEQRLSTILEQSLRKTGLSEEDWKRSKGASALQCAPQEKWLSLIRTLNSLAISDLPASSVDLVGIEPTPSADEWSALSRLIGLTHHSRSEMSSPADVRRRSLFFLLDGRVLLAELPNLLDSLWEKFDRVGGELTLPVLPHHRTYSPYPAVSSSVATWRISRSS